MNWILVIFAAIAALFGGGFVWWLTRVGRELGVMRSTATSLAADIAGTPPGTLVELKGALHTDTPLTGEYSGKDCVYSRVDIERQVERTTHDGNGKRRTERVYETESSVEHHAPSSVQDSSGSAALVFEGAKVEAVQVHQHFEASTIGVVGSLFNVSGTVLGHRYTEWAIAPDAQVYVLGTVLAGGAVGRAEDKKNPFVISTRSEEERTKSLGWGRLWLLLAIVLCFGLAAVLCYYAFQS